ncbi:gamma-glutamyl-gamma-aminobutyrate hydrolase family protein [Mesorhizobium caraganae]|uniref:gamma-glutamyl-gamma-aminobutyrate hydrolase family protein n=1 Tax=Mesorhizobium caraganae TaxID=483206 RepID=UPI003ECDB29D
MAKHMQPIIGITSNFDLDKKTYITYDQDVRAIEEAGAVPIILPYVKTNDINAILNLISGLVLPGGKDFPTALYGATPHPAVKGIIPQRDTFEFALARSALDRSMPILGICRGMQLLNVVSGGTIYPHTLDELANVLDHREGMPPLSHPAHEVQIERSSLLWRACGEPPSSFRVNSGHHQAVKEVAPEFVVSARASDGVVEAIEAPGRPFVIGVQWHPEMMYESEPACRQLIDNFVKACSSIGRVPA